MARVFAGLDTTTRAVRPAQQRRDRPGVAGGFQRHLFHADPASPRRPCKLLRRRRDPPGLGHHPGLPDRHLRDLAVHIHPRYTAGPTVALPSWITLPACTVRKPGFGYTAWEYSLIRPLSTRVRRSRTVARSVTGVGDTSRAGGRCSRP